MSQNQLPPASKQLPLPTLVEYIGMCCEMETNILQQEYLLGSLRSQRELLGIPKAIYPPARINEQKQSKGTAFLIWAILSYVVAGIFGLVSFAGIRGGVVDFIFTFIIVLSISTGLIFLGSFLLRRYKLSSYEYRDQQYREEVYSQEMQRYYFEVNEDKKRLLFERKQIQYLDIQINLIESKLTSSRNVRTTIYKPNIIYQNYRNLPALTSFYDYFMAGICTELGGPHGAYQKYDLERRMDKIIIQLDVIIDDLGMIRDNQQTLFREMCALKDTNERLLGSINSMRDEYASRSLQMMDSLNSINSNINNVGRQAMIGNASNIANQQYLRSIANNADLINRNAELARKEQEFIRRKLYS